MVWRAVPSAPPGISKTSSWFTSSIDLLTAIVRPLLIVILPFFLAIRRDLIQRFWRPDKAPSHREKTCHRRHRYDPIHGYVRIRLRLINSSILVICLLFLPPFATSCLALVERLLSSALKAWLLNEVSEKNSARNILISALLIVSCTSCLTPF